MDLATLLRGFGAGLTAAGLVTGVEALAWVRWGRTAVLEWQETEALTERLIGRRSPRASLTLHILIGGFAGIAFALSISQFSLGPTLAWGLGFGFLLWVITLLIHGPITKSPAHGTGVAVSLLSHILYGALLGGWAV